VESNAFETGTGISVPAVTAAEMANVDQVATESVGLALLSMMENAGRNLAAIVRRVRTDESVLVLAGAGGNGGGGLSCARHLANRDLPVSVVLDGPAAALSGATETQYRVLDAMDVRVGEATSAAIDGDVLVVDALVGYGLTGPLRGDGAALAEASADAAVVLALDIPSGVNATTGEIPGVSVDADTTLTLALPKTGLGPHAGDLFLGDIGIPAVVYDDLDIPSRSPFGAGYVVPIRRTPTDE
jgi:NAD(P)H-hydrate epimerase